MPNAPSGLMIVDKPYGVTSFDAVAATRAALHTKKVGHAGTLDPMATGMLVIGFGNATRLLNAITGHDKTYEATIRLGQRTDTDDAQGELLESAGAWGLDPGAIHAAIAEQLTGDIAQVPSAYSAIKINGRRAYDLAREGRQVKLAARRVTIEIFDVLDIRETSAENGTPVTDLDARVSCSSGTYIRSLARDLGELLGVGGHLIRLRRTRVGRFDFADPVIESRRVSAHTASKSYTNREGVVVARSTCVLDVPDACAADAGLRREWLLGRALTMEEAARRVMPCVDIDTGEAADLRFGRRIDRAITSQCAAIVPQTHDVVALIEPAGRSHAKPVTVFPATVDAVLSSGDAPHCGTT